MMIKVDIPGLGFIEKEPFVSFEIMGIKYCWIKYYDRDKSLYYLCFDTVGINEYQVTPAISQTAFNALSVAITMDG